LLKILIIIIAMKFATKLKLLSILIISLSLVYEISSLSLRKIESDISIESERHKSSHKASSKSKVKAAAKSEASVEATKTAGKTVAKATANSKQQVNPSFNATNVTISSIMYKDLNTTYVKQDLHTFKTETRKWADLKIFDKQLEDIYQDLIYKHNHELTPEAGRAAVQIFANQFQACDGNHDNVLDISEFSGCMANDTYLRTIVTPSTHFATYANYTFTNTTGFYPILFNVIDSYKLNYTNFHDYMMLRLMSFSWRKCSVNAPFIEEVAFECAIEIAYGSKTLSRNTARRLYKMALELSNTQSVRNIDFVTYFIIAQSVRLFGKINNKEDGDVTRSEMNLALDGNVLPSRYNQDVINQMFKLVEEHEKSNQGIDLLSFVFYDFILRIFEVPNAQKKWNLAKSEFTQLFNHYLFPYGTLQEVQMIPQNNLTAQSYQMYTYLNVSQFHQEADHFLKFAQKNEKVLKSEKSSKSKNLATFERKLPGNNTFDLVATSNWLFNILDNDSDGFLNFYDYGSFIQIAYLFSRFDQYQNGRVVAGNLYEKYTSYADFPYVSSEFRDRAKRFNLFSQDLYIDLLRSVLVMRIDDIINANKRRVDPTTLFEVELKKIFSTVNLGNVPDAYLNKCLRGVDENNIPKYDWECSFIQGVTLTSKYLESSDSYLTAKQANLTLLNTAFINVDPQIK
jgi:hypothetical protein